MNRLVCTSTDAITPDQLPPSTRAPGAPARVLFSHSSALGFGTTSRTLVDYAASRADIDAVHITLPLNLAQRAFGKELPKGLRGWDFHNSRMTAAFSRPLMKACRDVLRPEHFDIVHIMTRERAGIVLRPWARVAGSPKYVVNVDTTLRSWDEAYEIRRTAPKLDYHTDERVLRAADAVAFASRWAMNSAIQQCGVDASRAILHMPCVPAALGSPRTAPSSGPLNIIFIGNDWIRKGGPRLLAWHQQQWADRAELHVCSAHAPVDRSARHVRWHGKVDHSTLVGKLLPTMDLCVIPTWEDTFLIAAQEAQAAGVPVITSKLAAIPEVVQDGQTGLLVQRNDDAGFVAAVERLMADAPTRLRMSAQAIAHVRDNLNADVWHHHLLDQLVALADDRPLRTLPAIEQASIA